MTIIKRRISSSCKSYKRWNNFRKILPIIYLKHKITLKTIRLLQIKISNFLISVIQGYVIQGYSVWIAQLHLDTTIIPKERRVFSTNTELRMYDIFYSCSYSAERHLKELLAVSEAGADFSPHLLACRKDVLLTLGKIRIVIEISR